MQRSCSTELSKKEVLGELLSLNRQLPASCQSICTHKHLASAILALEKVFVTPTRAIAVNNKLQVYMR